MNPLFQQQTKSTFTPAMQSIQRMINIYKTAQNPQQALDQLATKNPVISQIMQEANGDLKGLFYKLCEQKGVKPDNILQQLNMN